MSQLVGDFLRAPVRGAGRRGAADSLDRAAAGAAISILGACASDEGIGPLPKLASGLVGILLDRPSAAE